jgi:putative colanic acid biosynthesis UDP-glucose lipid carrier transferase
MPTRAPSDRPLNRGSSSLSTTLQAGLDGLAVIAITWGATVIVNDGVFSLDYVLALLALMATMAVSYDQFGVYGQHGSFTAQSLALLRAWLVSFALLLLLAFALKVTATYSRAVLAAVFFGGFAAQLAIHVGFRVVHGAMKAAGHAAPALIVGTGALAEHLHRRIESNPWLLQHVVGAVKVNGARHSDAPENGDALPVLGTVDETVRLVREHGVRNVYIAVDLNASPMIEEVYFNLLDRNVNVHWVPNIFALRLINHSIGDIAGLPLLTLSETPLIGTRRLVKELEDKVLGGVLLLLLAVPMLLIALAIRLDTPGPVFFRQTRTGWDGRAFRIWKFRSMVVQDAPAGPIRQATRDDPRVTRVGRVLRRLSLDELPQLFNVLAGEMSLVGPRPHEVRQNLEYSHKVTAYLARHRIKPGMTGLAQVRGYRGETSDLREMTRRVESDIEYINTWTLWLDLTILGRTVFALTGKKAY